MLCRRFRTPDVTECFLPVQSQSVVSSVSRSSWHKHEYKLRKTTDTMSLVWLKSLQTALLYLCLSMLVSRVILRRERQLGVRQEEDREGKEEEKYWKGVEGEVFSTCLSTSDYIWAPFLFSPSPNTTVRYF